MFKNKIYNYFILLIYFISLFELLNYKHIYKVSKLYYFILKLNSDQNYIILYLIFIFIIIFNNQFRYNYIIFYIFFSLVIYSFNTNIFDIKILDNSINKNLTNGLLIIHPIILYLSYGMLLFIVYKNVTFKYNFLFFNKYFIFYKDIINFTTIILILSVFLGSWWAEQELSWGGWWSWDFIEIITLNFFFILLLFIHIPNYKNIFFFFEVDLFFKIIVFMLIVRFNFLNSIHNFISNNFFFQFFFELSFIYMLFVYISLKLKKINYNLFITSNSVNFLYLLFFLLILNLFFYVLLEFINLIYTYLNLVSMFKKNKILYFYIIFAYILFLYKSNYINITFQNFYEYVYINIFFVFNFKKKNTYITHFLVFLYLYIILFNLYFIDKNSYIPYSNISNINCNSVFFNNNNFYLSENVFSKNFNNSIFFKLSFIVKNKFIELFSFNNFIFIIINLNLVFIIVILLLLNYIYSFLIKTINY